MTRVAYLVSRYPAVSHAFIEREVLALRELGVQIDTFSLRRATDEETLSPTDRTERESTYALQPVGLGRLIGDNLSVFAESPARYLVTLRWALARGRNARERLWQCFYLAKAALLLAELRRRDLGHVHVHFANAGADVAMLATRLAGGDLNWSLTLHGPAEFFDVTQNRVAEKLAAADWVACVSDWVRSQAMALLPPEQWAKLRVVRLGIETSAWTPVERTDTRDLRILNVGRLDPVKGQAVLIDAVARLRERGVDARCTIVGGGTERAALERLAHERGVADRVELTGPVGQDRIRALYEEADVFCLPSFRESLPVVLMEALATELPVVATRIMGVPELIEDGVTGVLVNPGQPGELADALARLAGDRELRRRLGRAGRERVERDHDVARLAADLRTAFAAPATAAVSTNT